LPHIAILLSIYFIFGFSLALKLTESHLTNQEFSQHGEMVVNMQPAIMNKLALGRLVLSGVILGVAAVSIVGSVLGWPSEAYTGHEVAGGLLGAAGVLGIKALHLI
jgi:hypothetical protein